MNLTNAMKSLKVSPNPSQNQENQEQNVQQKNVKNPQNLPILYNFFSSFLSEYRYLVSHDLYIHTILDYGYYSDATNSKKDNLFGVGFGFGLLTKNGLLNMVYANGSSGNQNIQLSNSVVHLSLKLDLF